ncbi:hypothetical protein SLEP1_g27328 [Rubroshorea leprosula]|uniref:PB1 domain-containing protein n=1 Tax=Rubroshorea leprosula TaxID=152421 RepID=A0AAV5JX62_9ROSI|nr:hypothetical protein SLEP1_g27328 [Rubroshorea leprosula]
MDRPPPTSGGKLRLMCSYGGHIILRPHSKSLCYLGGESPIVSVPASTALSVSSLIAHLDSTLHITTLFTVKYLIPYHDLDALICIANEDDLRIMVEELESLSASPDPSRIRLFLFPIKPTSLVFTQSSLPEVEQPTVHRREGTGARFGLGLHGAELIRTELSQAQSSRRGLNHPKTESWFVDALRSAKIVQKGDSGVAGFGAESGGSGQSEGIGLCGQESFALETSSFFWLDILFGTWVHHEPRMNPACATGFAINPARVIGLAMNPARTWVHDIARHKLGSQSLPSREPRRELVPLRTHAPGFVANPRAGFIAMNEPTSSWIRHDKQTHELAGSSRRTHPRARGFVTTTPRARGFIAANPGGVHRDEPRLLGSPKAYNFPMELVGLRAGCNVVLCDSKCASGISCVQSGTCQDPFVPISAMERKISVSPY